MVARYRDISEKYRSARLQPDSIYGSLTVKTIFNKFIRRGKKATANRHLCNALVQHRIYAPEHQIYNTLQWHIRALTHKVNLVLVRKGKKFHEVPVPAFRLKATVATLQALFSAMMSRSGRTLSDRIFAELYDLTVNEANSEGIRRTYDFHRLVFESRVHMEKRWK